MRVLAALAIVFSATVPEASAQHGGTVYHLSTTAGRSVLLHQYDRWDGGCRSTGDVIITPLNRPQGGTLDKRRETKLDAGAARVGDTDCQGRPIPAIALYYTPRAGFTGSDRFSFRIDYGRGAITEEPVIAVR